MSRRSLIALSSAYFLLLCAALGSGSLWPFYLAQLGGGASAAGIFNAVGNIASVAATLLSGWLAGRFGRRKLLFLLSCALFAVTWWLMGRARTWQELTLINFFGGFTFGMGTNLILILTGLLADAAQRGRSFGLLSLTMGASLLVSGVTFGPIADRWGFPTLMAVNAAICAVCLAPGLFLVEPAVSAAATPDPAAPSAPAGAGLGRRFYFLVATALIISIASFGGNLGRSIVMSQYGFSATAISLTTAIGGAVSLPAPLLIGWLSDHIGRKRLLLLCLVAGFFALVAFAFAGSAWGFWGASVLLALMMSAQPLMQALAADMLPPAAVGVGLSLISGATSVGLFVSSLGMGFAIQQAGGRPAFLAIALAPLLAMAMTALSVTGQPRRRA
ncbi:MAG: Major Facilitator Superfamily protein [Chloroflexi bacterium ADurb.Bin325]|nr:MAG: Major Facilitator Superfamily protein [Chloroflexi bacterium ADurb.Bin325]